MAMQVTEISSTVAELMSLPTRPKKEIRQRANSPLRMFKRAQQIETP
jgi:hypothetical protein